MHFRSSRAGTILRGMRTYLFPHRVALDDLTVVERPIPNPGPRQILVQVRAASINFRDVAIARGDYGAFQAPLVPLSDAAGTVVARGREVTRFTVGDLVCPVYVPDWRAGALTEAAARRRLGGPNEGVLAEYLVLDEEDAVRAPAHLDPVEAATLPIAAVTVWQELVVAARITAGDVVAVQGTGGVSLFTLLLARAVGCRVVVITRQAERIPRLQALGATALDASSDWAGQLLEITDGRGVDVFVDVVGDVARAIPVTRMGGTIVLVGFVGARNVELELPALLRRAITLRAASAGSRATFEALVRAMEAHELRPIVDRMVPFAEAKDAYDILERGRPFGKVVIDVTEVAS